MSRSLWYSTAQPSSAGSEAALSTWATASLYTSAVRLVEASLAVGGAKAQHRGRLLN